ncbi:hypothetical protein ACFXAF_35800 [Kitasatospora sp. NPDC059463]|uniref:hypothetical protein n=1 Tax=unclassified Kitasatospora TaxID=2633591 RepID=UPI0036AFB03A
MLLGLDELQALDSESARTLNELLNPERSLWVVRAQHAENPYSPDLRESFLLVIDEAPEPGVPQVLGVHLHRDLADRTVRAGMHRSVLIPLAQNWLVGRGADPDLVREPDGWSDPVDAETARLEDLLRSSGSRYEIRNDYNTTTAPYEKWVIADDTDALDPKTPVAVFVWRRESDDDTTYTVRGGHFATVEAAHEWTRDTSASLPEPSRPATSRAEAARSGGQEPIRPAYNTPVDDGADRGRTPPPDDTRPRGR